MPSTIDEEINNNCITIDFQDSLDVSSCLYIQVISPLSDELWFWCTRDHCLLEEIHLLMERDVLITHLWRGWDFLWLYCRIQYNHYRHNQCMYVLWCNGWTLFADIDPALNCRRHIVLNTPKSQWVWFINEIHF